MRTASGPRAQPVGAAIRTYQLCEDGMAVEQFFTQYAALSMGEEERALAGVYAPSFFVGGPKGSMTFTNDARFLD